MADEYAGALEKKDGALRAAAVSAAVGLAVYGLRKTLAGSSAGLSLHRHDEPDEEEGRVENGRRRSGSLVISALDSASDSLLPLAEAAAEEVGRWAAKNSPALVRDRLIPRFIDAFKAAA